jgi:hypothetical protein
LRVILGLIAKSSVSFAKLVDGDYLASAAGLLSRQPKTVSPRTGRGDQSGGMR